VDVVEILDELERLLEPGRFEDYCPNGLQVPGAASVTTVATGVSAHAELFELAAAEEADLLVVHHGLFWGSSSGAIDAALKRRLQILFEADIGLAAYHLPLDAHPELGNNALLARALGATELEPSRFIMASRSASSRASPARGSPRQSCSLGSSRSRRASRSSSTPGRLRCAASRSSREPGPTTWPRQPRRGRTRC